jgi:lipoprotein-anchoring transpeptidase ErfK/SrfK
MDGRGAIHNRWRLPFGSAALLLGVIIICLGGCAGQPAVADNGAAVRLAAQQVMASGLPADTPLERILRRGKVEELGVQFFYSPYNEQGISPAEFGPSDAPKFPYQQWITETLDYTRMSGEIALLVIKDAAVLYVLNAGMVQESYPVVVGRNALADKRMEGDMTTPEGHYRITEVKGPGETRFHRAFMLDYPNDRDREEFAYNQRCGFIPQWATIGGEIMLHGKLAGGDGTPGWTHGCIELANADADALAELVATGTRVTVVRYGELPADSSIPAG